MLGNVFKVALGIGGVVVAGKVLANVIANNSELEEIKEKIVEEHERRKDFDLDIISEIAGAIINNDLFKDSPIPFVDEL